MFSNCNYPSQFLIIHQQNLILCVYHYKLFKVIGITVSDNVLNVYYIYLEWDKSECMHWFVWARVYIFRVSTWDIILIRNRGVYVVVIPCNSVVLEFKKKRFTTDCHLMLLDNCYFFTQYFGKIRSPDDLNRGLVNWDLVNDKWLDLQNILNHKQWFVK